MDRLIFKEIIKKILTGQAITVKEMAITAGLDRSTLSTIKNATTEKEVEENTINKVKKAFPAYFETTPNNVSHENKDLPEQITFGQAMETILNLTVSNRMLAEAQLILANKINSGGSDRASSSFSAEAATDKKHGIQRLPLGNKKQTSVKVKRKGSAVGLSR